MKRRALLAGIAAAGATKSAPRGESETLYIPSAHRVEDLALLHDLMDGFPFVELVTVPPTLRITQLPVWLDRESGPYGTVYGHLARSNPQSAAIENGTAAVIVFRGPHAYISPSWYANSNTVPTWNFAVAHASGKLEPVKDEAALYQLLSTLVTRSEGRYASSEYDFTKLPRDYARTLMRGIAGFRMRIESIEGKFKLGQERGESDRNGIVRHLKSAPRERSIAEFTSEFYSRRKPPISK